VTSLQVLKLLRRAVIFVLGISVVGIGCVMFVTPGPGFLGVLAGLALLATEFVWARHLLQRLKRRMEQLRERASNQKPPESGPPAATG